MKRQRGQQCSCGCGQKTAQTMRQRRLQCDGCGCPLRMTRAWIERNGLSTCGCGGTFVPDCLEDRCRIPGAEGDAAWAEYQGRATVSAERAEQGRKGGETTARRRAARQSLDPARQPGPVVITRFGGVVDQREYVSSLSAEVPF